MRWLGEASRKADRVAAAAETRRAPIAVFLVSLGVWWLQALVMPLAGGRDFGTYLGAYVELFQFDPIDLGYVLGRTPVAPLVVGGVLDLAGGALAEAGVSVLYAVSVTAWFLAARTFGGRAALLTAVVLLLYPSYGIRFHEISSDTVLAVAFAGWSLLAVRVLLAPTPARFALVGAGVALLVLVRPGNQALLVLAVLPLVLSMPWRARVASSLASSRPRSPSSAPGPCTTGSATGPTPSPAAVTRVCRSSESFSPTASSDPRTGRPHARLPVPSSGSCCWRSIAPTGSASTTSSPIRASA